MHTTIDTADVPRRALDEPRLTLDDLAEVAGVSRSSLDKYRQGSPLMPETIRLRLAAFLDSHAERMREIAEELRHVET